MLIAGKKFLVTGAGNGMGREVTLELLKRGASVIGVDINDGFLKETTLLAGAKSSELFTVKLDITDRKEVAELASKHSAICSSE